MRVLKIFFLLIFLSVAVFLLFQAGYIFPGPKNKKVEIYIPEGSNGEKVAKALSGKKVTRSATILSAYLSYKDIAGKLKVGHYIFIEGSNISEIGRTLLKGPLMTSKWVTIPEGFSVDRIAERIDRKGKLSKDGFSELVLKPENFEYKFLEDGIGTLEGYLFPQTYKVELNTTNEDFIKMMLDEFKTQIQSIDLERMKTRGLTPHQLLTVASLIERETKVSAERQLVASVIFNRLARGMPLQIDATVQYALPEWKDRLVYSDLKVDSPYNTYLHKGLPPGPICSPGMESIKAALYPAQTRYIYYVLKDNYGNHHFASNYEDFLKAKKQRKK